MSRIFGLVLLFVAFNVSAIEINPTLSGSWFNPDQNGHGLSVEILDEDTTIIYWYVYHPDGTPMFLITVGQNQGNRVSGTTYYQTGMRFGNFNPNDIDQKVWGSVTVTFNDCGSATLNYSSNDAAYGNGTIPMQRLASIAGLKCTESYLQGNYTTVTLDGNEAELGAAMLFDNGNMAYFVIDANDTQIGLGWWNATSDDRFTYEATEYSIYGGANVISGSGEYSLNNFTATQTNNERLFAFPDNSFQGSASYEGLAGNYSITNYQNDEVVGSLTIDGNGTVSGRNYDGCDLKGWFHIPDPQFNQLYMELEALNCANAGSRVTGAARLGNENRISVMASDGQYGYFWELN